VATRAITGGIELRLHTLIEILKRFTVDRKDSDPGRHLRAARPGDDPAAKIAESEAEIAWVRSVKEVIIKLGVPILEGRNEGLRQEAKRAAIWRR
jgi:hypothetical protein